MINMFHFDREKVLFGFYSLLFIILVDICYYNVFAPTINSTIDSQLRENFTVVPKIID